MKRILLSTLAVAGLCSTSLAQFIRPHGSEISIGLEGSLPLNGWDLDDGLGKASNFGFGASAKYAYNFNETFAATLLTGFSYFPGKDHDGFKINSYIIPVKVGVRAFVKNFYVEPSIGFAQFHSSLKEDGDSYSSSTTAFAYGLGIGYFVSQDVDLGLRYENLSKDGNSIGYMAFRIAYNFSLGK